MSVKLFVEGGGDKSTDIACREGFHKLLESAGFGGRMPRIKACGSRNDAYTDFAFHSGHREGAPYPMLLVDSEGPVAHGAWKHLKARDGWSRPKGAAEDQAQLMVQCMETWIVADPEALTEFFGEGLRLGHLPPITNLEPRAKSDIQDSLTRATAGCGRGKKYEKGKRSFEILARLNPELLKMRLPHFDRFCNALGDHLQTGKG